jgi:hypothetical protein
VEIAIAGIPGGDVTFVTDLNSKDGKLTIELIDKASPTSNKCKITKVEAYRDKLAIYFESFQGSEISIDLAKVANDNLEGTLMRFPVKTKRTK